MNNTEDKLAWCESFGEDAEREFCVSRMFELGVASWLNIEKRTNKYTHDLFAAFPADLKTVRTPLFKAQELFGIDPQYAVTFNLKDGKRYRELYPNIVVIFDIRWDTTQAQLGNTRYSVEPMHITVAGFLNDIANAVKASGNQKIEYKRRREDHQGNAKESFVFDCRYLHRLAE